MAMETFLPSLVLILLGSSYVNANCNGPFLSQDKMFYLNAMFENGLWNVVGTSKTLNLSLDSCPEESALAWAFQFNSSRLFCVHKQTRLDALCLSKPLHAPIDGQWSEWGSYGNCSSTCGPNCCQKWRERFCNNPEPSFRGLACFGTKFDSTSCPCRVDGKWTDWSSWSACSSACGSGTQSRSRNCTNPPPAYGGAPCSLPSTEMQSCNTQPCPIDGSWGDWSGWSMCTKSCGNGAQTQTRNCDKPAPAYGGAQCTGSGTMNQSCNTQDCPIVGNWGDWSGWSICTKTCGNGTQIRTRTCDEPAPADGRALCFGSGIMIQFCNTQGCSAIMSKNYPNNYPNNYFQEWILEGNGNYITLVITDMDIEYCTVCTEPCSYDNLQVYDGSPTGQLLAKWCGSVYPLNVTSTTNTLYVKMTTDSEATYRGFTGYYFSHN